MVVNYLSVNLQTNIVLYVDDTTVITRNSHQELVENWLTANNLILNNDNTSTIFSFRECPNMLKEGAYPKVLGLLLILL